MSASLSASLLPGLPQPPSWPFKGEVRSRVKFLLQQLWTFLNEPGDWIVEELVDAVYRVGADQGESPKRPEYKYSTDADTNTPIG